jgi:hypothetical protein
VPLDRADHDQRAARITTMLEELRLNTEDLHELAKQATDRSWEAVRTVRLKLDEVRAHRDVRPTKMTRKPKRL